MYAQSPFFCDIHFICSFLLAGHETTSVATTWALFALSQSPRIQGKLREELLAVPTETPTMDELNSLPYLDNFVHETLRLHPPVTNTMRAANEDDVIPLSEPIVDKKGDLRHEILYVNRSSPCLYTH